MEKAPVKFTLYVDEQTRTDLRFQALREGVPATVLVARLVREYLKAKTPRPKKAR